MTDLTDLTDDELTAIDWQLAAARREAGVVPAILRERAPAGFVGTIYLLCFDRPMGNAANPRAMATHYMGWTTDLDARLAAHTAGQGASITRAAIEQGITWTLVRTWTGTRDDERKLKNQKQGPKLCPTCRARRTAERNAA
jgi:predicted GIY-YIG superfamily endonuclease